MQYKDAIGDGEGLLLVVGDKDRGGAQVLEQCAQPVPEFLANLRIERAEGFVEQQQARAVCQRACQRRALALTATQLRGQLARTAAEADLFQQLVAAPGTFAPVHAKDPQRELDVLGHGHVFEQGVVLENETQVTPLRRLLGHIDPVDLHLAAVAGRQAGNNAQDGALAAAARAQQGDEFAIGHLEGHLLDHRAATETLADLAHP